MRVLSGWGRQGGGPPPVDPSLLCPSLAPSLAPPSLFIAHPLAAHAPHTHFPQVELFHVWRKYVYAAEAAVAVSGAAAVQ